jgi:hypothetical protein
MSASPNIAAVQNELSHEIREIAKQMAGWLECPPIERKVRTEVQKWVWQRAVFLLKSDFNIQFQWEYHDSRMEIVDKVVVPPRANEQE